MLKNMSDSVGTGSNLASLTFCVNLCYVHKPCESAVLILKIVVFYLKP